jgi:hypothetical protein
MGCWLVRGGEFGDVAGDGLRPGGQRLLAGSFAPGGKAGPVGAATAAGVLGGGLSKVS